MSDMGMDDFERQFADDYVIGDTDEIVHLFWGLSQAINYLDATEVFDGLKAEFSWFSMMVADPEGFWAGIYTETDADAVNLQASKFMDSLGEWVKSAGRRMAAFVTEHGIPGVHFPVFMPCHGGWAALSFNVDEQQPILDLGPSRHRPDEG